MSECFWTIYTVLSICVSIFVPISYCFDDSRLVVQFETKEHLYLHLSSSFSRLFSLLGSFCLNTNFRIIYSQFSHSVMSDSATPWTAARQASLSITNSWSLLKLMSIESVMLSNHLILCCPLLLLPSFFPSIRVFSNATGIFIGIKFNLYIALGNMII